MKTSPRRVLEPGCSAALYRGTVVEATLPFNAVEATRMVRLATVAHPFHARVIAARVGCEGIVTELRGAVGGPYPMGDIHVYVAEIDLPVAQELLLADEVESAFDDDEVVDASPPPALWMVVAAMVLVSTLMLLRF